jgi:multidrug resistance protein MdtO
MAALAADPTAPSWPAVLARLRPAPGRAAFTVRIALICALTAGAVAAFGTPDAALTIYVVFFLNRGDRTASIVASVAMLLLMTFILGFSMIAAILVVNSPIMRVAAIALISFCLLFLTSASRLRPVGAIVALIVGYALDLLGTIVAGEEATRALLYVWLFVAFPAAVTIVISLLIAPSPRSLLQKTLAARLVMAAGLLADPGPEKAAAVRRTLRGGDAALAEYLRMTALERTATPGTIAALGQAIRSSTVVLELAELACRDEVPAIDPLTAGRLAHSLKEMAAILAGGSYPIEVDTVIGDAGPVTDGDRLAREIDRALVAFAIADGADKPLPAVHKGFFEEDAFANKEHVLFALRTTCAALFCFLLYSLLDWPGIHTCFLTVYIVSLGTAAESVEKLALRITGCLLGAVLGYAALLLLLPSITSVGGLMLLVFAGTAIAAWVVAGGPFVAYAGFQLAFAFLLCVVQGAGPAFDLTVARDRIIGILIGNLVAYVALTRLWPTSVAARIDTAIAGLVRLLARAARAPDLAAASAGAVGTGFGAIARDIELTAYEPEMVGQPSEWRGARRRLVEAVDRIAAPLLLAARSDMPGLDAVANELDGLAEAITKETGTQETGTKEGGTQETGTKEGGTKEALYAGDGAAIRLAPLRSAITGLRSEVAAAFTDRGGALAAA